MEESSARRFEAYVEGFRVRIDSRLEQYG